MDRRQFLRLLGAATFTIVGARGIIKGLQGLAHDHTGRQVNGYGSSVYGGRKPTVRRI